jgi:hypothetical protein
MQFQHKYTYDIDRVNLEKISQCYNSLFPLASGCYNPKNPEPGTLNIQCPEHFTPSSLMRYFQMDKLKVCAITWCKINKGQGINDLQEEPLEDGIHKKHHEFLPVFSNVITDTLPPYQPHDHNIKLQEHFTPPFEIIYSLFRKELQHLKE